MLTYREKDYGVWREYELSGPVERYQTKRQLVEMVPSTRFGQTLFVDGELQLSEKDEYIYHELLVHPALFAAQKRKRVCIIGGGDGCAAREALTWRDVEYVHIIDWDDELTQLFKDKYRNLNQYAYHDPRVYVENVDILSVLGEQRQFDVILIDLTDPDVQDTESLGLYKCILASVRNWLAPGGSLVMNAGGILPWDTLTVHTFADMIPNLFKEKVGYSFQAYKAFVPSFGREWVYFLLAPSASIDIQVPSVANHVRYLNGRTWYLAKTWSSEYETVLPTTPVKLNTYA